METEVWPNLLVQCRRQQIPVVLANARLSERSLRKAKRFSAVMQEAAANFSVIAAQTQADAERLRLMGAANVQVTGSLKFDVQAPEAALTTGQLWRRQFEARPVLLCASTREGEEALILQAFTDWLAEDASAARCPNLLLMLVPRHPQRFEEVAELVRSSGLRLHRRSQGMGQEKTGHDQAEDCHAGPAQGSTDPRPVAEKGGVNPAQAGSLQTAQVLLGDSMGEMFAYYQACDVAFIGGSLLPFGSQNLIEACAVGKPVLAGPSTFNFQTITEDAIAAGGAKQVEDASAMLALAVQWLNDEALRKQMGDNARQFAAQHRGATQRILALLRPLMKNA